MAPLTIPALSEAALLSGEVSRIVLESPVADSFEAICQQYWGLRVERNAAGEVILMAPEGNESSYRNSEIDMQLRQWAKAQGLGVCFGPNTAFKLPDGSALGPDAAWVSIARMQSSPRTERSRFLRLTPEFVIELRSPTDSWPRSQQKMLDWQRNGVELGWLIDADNRMVCIYAQGAGPAVLENPECIIGTVPVTWFRLEMNEIWRGLDF